MAKISLYSDSRNTATSVSNVFIDEYMSNANGEFVKIYLYLLRCMNSPDAEISISAMADKFEHTEKDIKRALHYWERMHLLRLEYDEEKNLTGVCFVDSSDSQAVPTVTASNRKQVSATAPSQTLPSDKADSDKSSKQKAQASSSQSEEPKKASVKQYTADELQNFRKDENVAELLFITERYFGRPLTSTDTFSILYWNDELGFSLELIEYLIEYCVSKGHTNIHYLEKVALAWANEGVKTVEQAKQLSTLHNQLYFAVMKAFGISGRNLVASEMEFIDKWTNTYEFSSAIILEGCSKTMSAIHQPSFEYTDRILSNWKKAGIRSLEEIAKSDEAFQKKKTAHSSTQPTTNASKNKFNNFTQRSYDYDELEKMLLTTNVH